MNKFYRKPAIVYGSLRVLLFLAVWIIFLGLIEFFGLRMMDELFPEVDQRSIPFGTIARTLSFLITLLILFFFRKYVDRRPFFKGWFGITSRKYDFPIGVLAGAVLISVGAFFLGRLKLVELSPGSVTGLEFLQYSIFFLIAAALEEVVFRGYILDNLLEDMHPILALIVSSILFMALHLLNPSLEFLPVLNLFLAGVMLGASYIYTRNLWFPLGLHWSWNMFQGPVFGFEVSGVETKSFFSQSILKDNIWTGGDFGFEGSILATILIMSAATVIFLVFQKFYLNENI